VPLLRVTVQDGLNKAQAFASIIPYLDVLEPNGTVISESQGDVVSVLAAIPLVAPGSLKIKVNGTDIVPLLGLNPATRSRAGRTTAWSCSAANPVGVSDLIVRSAPIHQLSSNTVTLRLEGLGCGAHLITIEGTKRVGSIPNEVTPDCLVDDLMDTGTANGFAIHIFTPAPGEQVASGPVHVTARPATGCPSPA